MNILLILLGSHIEHLLRDRVDTAIRFVHTLSSDTRVIWFLSGGVKDLTQNNITEAVQMSNYIRTHHTCNCVQDYIYDIKSTNTAENMLAANKHVNQSDIVYDKTYIITSQFHYERANHFANKLLSFTPFWILGGAECEDSRYWERIHMRNVGADVRKALEKSKI